MDKEKSEYLGFIKKHFPNSGIITNECTAIIYSRICENNLITDIYCKYIDNFINNSNVSPYKVFLKRYKNQLNKLLLYLPLYDFSCINFCMRASIENLLKFIYSIYFNKELEVINRCSFRHIREDLNSVETQLYFNKNIIGNLIKSYGEFSNSIHDKSKHEIYEIEFIENIIQNGTYDISNLDKKILNMLNCYENLMPNVFQVKEEELSAAERVRLKNSLSSKRFEKIIKSFYK
jgi:hypothetical protein